MTSVYIVYQFEVIEIDNALIRKSPILPGVDNLLLLVTFQRESIVDVGEQVELRTAQFTNRCKAGEFQ